MKSFLQTALLLTILAIPGQAKTWLAVSPDPELTEALAPLIAQRQAQGLTTVVSTSVAFDSAPDYLLLIGDEQLIPAKRGSQYRWLSTQREFFAADPLFSDVDSDGLPDFPVGRIPARTPEQLAAVVAKIIAYENRPLGTSDLNLPIWSGTPAYGKLLDETADWLLMSAIKRYAPKWGQPWIITANPNNTLNAWPSDQAALFNQQILRGAAFTTMMGHGNTDLFLSMESPGGNHQALGEIVYTNHHASALDDPGKIASPLVIFACDCGNFAHQHKTSLAATLLLGHGGTVATIAATTQSHPLTNYYSSIALMEEIRRPAPAARAGDLWLAAQASAQQMRKPLIERTLKNVEGALEVEIDIPKLKRDQMLMYAYLGDPALAITLPTPLQLTLTKSESGTWDWSAEKPAGAERLIVQHRPLTKPLRIKPRDANRDQALQLFAKRNAQFEFKTLAELPSTTDWSGQVNAPGDLRIISFSKSKIQVATEKLR